VSEKAMHSDIAEYALRLGDDALILGQRLCEWSSTAPMLEEDIAIANVALDYFGRARMLLQYAGSLSGRTEDQLAFQRDSAEFKNLLLVEQPRGDFAFSMIKQYLLDEFELLYFARLCTSADATLAAIAAKTLKEIKYHQRRSFQWLQRLGLGTAESHTRAQSAIDQLWGYTAEFFALDEVEQRLVSAAIAVDRTELEAAWNAVVRASLEGAQFSIPENGWRASGGRRGVHSEHLGHMLAEMQFLQRAYPGLEW
jgi:ring-1,2-phenylacetyl-CoA epoxidase subunit PaaC